jgi:hypothetical protein
MKDTRVAEALETLRYLEEMTRPEGADITAKHKDRNAFSALACAGELVDLLAGWAIDHAVGLGLSRLRWVPRQIRGEKPYFKYLVAKIEVDDHRHEKNGGAQSRKGLKSFEKLDPIVLRQILINLLVRNTGGFPSPIQRMTVEALEALNYGETLPILKVVENNRKAKLLELKLQLEAVEFVEYWCAMGMLKNEAQKKVANAYAVSDTTVRLWKPRLHKELGQLEASSRIQIARNYAAKNKEIQRKTAAGLRTMETPSDRYGLEALKQAAERYKQFIKQRKS